MYSPNRLTTYLKNVEHSFKLLIDKLEQKKTNLLNVFFKRKNNEKLNKFILLSKKRGMDLIHFFENYVSNTGSYMVVSYSIFFRHSAHLSKCYHLLIAHSLFYFPSHTLLNQSSWYLVHKESWNIPVKLRMNETRLACIDLLRPNMESPAFEEQSYVCISEALIVDPINTAVFVSYRSDGLKPASMIALTELSRQILVSGSMFSASFGCILKKVASNFSMFFSFPVPCIPHCSPVNTYLNMVIFDIKTNF